MSVWQAIKEDLYRYSGKTGSKDYMHHLRNSPGFRFTFFLRLSTYYKKFHPIGIIANLYLKRLTYKYGYQIPKSVKIGKGFLIMHFGHLVVNSKSIIGNNCSLYHGVTIGATFRGAKVGVPVLGNEVWVGAGAVIVGGIKIGDNVLIAPNSYVNFNVPSNSVVVGNPAKIISKENATEGYIVNKI